MRHVFGLAIPCSSCVQLRQSAQRVQLLNRLKMVQQSQSYL